METPPDIPPVLRLNDDDPWHVCQSVFDHIAALVQPASATSVSETANALDQLAPGRRQLLEDEKAEAELNFFLSIWPTVVGIAKQLPHHSEAQSRLVELMEELARLPTMSTEREQKLWAPHHNELQHELENVFRLEWADRPTEFEDTYEPFQAWVNLNSFASQLFHKKLISQKLFPFKTLYLSLEDRRSSSSDLLESNVVAAAAWMEYSAAELFAIFREGESKLGVSERQVMGSLMFDDDEEGRVLSMERWAFWKQKLGDFAVDEELSLSAKTIAADAVRSMDQVDGSEVDGSES